MRGSVYLSFFLFFFEYHLYLFCSLVIMIPIKYNNNILEIITRCSMLPFLLRFGLMSLGAAALVMAGLGY